MRKIFLAITALALMGAGITGVYTDINSPAQAAVEAKKQAKKDKSKDGKDAEAHIDFVEMTPLILPIVDRHGVSQMISLVVKLEVADAHSVETVKKMSPRLTDAYIQDMYGVLNQTAIMPGGVVQVGVIKERLSRITTTILGEGLVNDVLLQHVAQNPL